MQAQAGETKMCSVREHQNTVKRNATIDRWQSEGSWPHFSQVTGASAGEAFCGGMGAETLGCGQQLPLHLCVEVFLRTVEI